MNEKSEIKVLGSRSRGKQTKKYEKKDNIPRRPSSREGGYVLISVGDTCYIRDKLGSFSTNSSSMDRGVSSTVVWSGGKGQNVPVLPFQTYSLGFVIDPGAIDVFQADFCAMGSRCMRKLEREVTSKSGVKKAQHIRVGWVTNYARHEPVGPGVKISRPTGSMDIFSNAVWYKYFRRSKKYRPLRWDPDMMGLNEAVVYAKEKNPIIGLLMVAPGTAVLPCSLVRQMKETVGILKEEMIKSPSLQLFLYDMHAPEHIVRYMSHEDGLEFLTSYEAVPSGSDAEWSGVLTEIFGERFRKAIPYRAEDFSAVNAAVLPQETIVGSRNILFQPASTIAPTDNESHTSKLKGK